VQNIKNYAVGVSYNIITFISNFMKFGPLARKLEGHTHTNTHMHRAR